MKQFLDLKEHFETNGTNLLKYLLKKENLASDTKLVKAIYYSMHEGKRIRPILAYVINKIFNGKLEDTDNVALSIELMHNFTLIHDDLPFLDDDNIRRNKPTIHIAFGGATAILAGDIMQSLAFRLINEDQSNILSKYAVEVSYGQSLELEENIPFETIVSKKTSSLIKASLLLGYSTTGKNDAQTIILLERLGELLGYGFQLQDDKFDGENNIKDNIKDIFDEARQLIKNIDNKDKLLHHLIDCIANRTY